jgi:MFS family permease
MGHRQLFVTGLAAFVAASAVCGAAPSIGVLVGARIAQGAAGGILNPQISATIQQLFRGAERGRAFGLFASVVSVGSAIGPLAGGALIAGLGVHAGWRAVFLVNVPIGLVLIPLAIRFLPAHGRVLGRRSGLDLVGAALLGAGIALILLPFIQGDWGACRWCLLAGAALVMAAFIRREVRVTDPILDVRLFRNRSYTIGASVITLYFAAFTPMFFVFTLMLQLGHRYSAIEAGLAITPFALGAALSGTTAGSLAAKYGRNLVVGGLGLMLIGFVGSALAVTLGPQHDIGWIALAPVFVAGVGGGVTLAPNQALTLAEVPVPQAGAAGGLYQTGQRIGASIGVATAGSAFFATLRGGGSYADAYGSAILVMSGIITAALLLALYDHHRANSPTVSAHP